MEIYIKGNVWIIKHMGLECLKRLKGIMFIMENGLKIRDKEKEMNNA